MDRAEMVVEVRRRLGEDTADFWVDSDIIRALDMGVMQFTREERWPWLYTESTQTMTAGVATALLPDDVDSVRAFNVKLQIGSEAPFLVRRVNPVEGYRLLTTHTTNNSPLYYYVSSVAQSTPIGVGDEVMKTTVTFIPTPDRNYGVKFMYFRRPAKLTADNQEPDMPEDYQPAIVAWATAQLWMEELVNSQVKASEQIQIYQKAVMQAQADVFKLAPDEEVVWGREQDEAERAGWPGIFTLPEAYGRPGGWWGG